MSSCSRRCQHIFSLQFLHGSARSGQNVSSVFVQLAGALAKACVSYAVMNVLLVAWVMPALWSLQANPPAAGEVGGATTGNGAHTVLCTRPVKS
eukprot:47425-Amphidinium_carterae.1